MPGEEDLGRCGRVPDDRKPDEVCNGIAVVEVLVRSAFSLNVVRLCAPCEVEHHAFYAERASNHRPRRTANSNRR